MNCQCYGHGGGRETSVLLERYGSCMKRTLVIQEPYLSQSALVSRLPLWP